ncbi:hypothetical protein WOLCODRAFT_152658 [Wolfiporia cocos MD-104 SS10]|uniref:Uncharacterized protein n=1 Tax=Wolfiporia cocos (strain MD-104) TaxID=742152 RepID=A0A2H3JXQ0_WOLCO|nr:hypothetical protein WOLCODRAFT_152658 [Wolfiporia cocos MD-104 SS10]
MSDLAQFNQDEEDDHDSDDKQGYQPDEEEDASMWEQEGEQEEQNSGNESHNPMEDEPSVTKYRSHGDQAMASQGCPKLVLMQNAQPGAPEYWRLEQLC